MVRSLNNHSIVGLQIPRKKISFLKRRQIWILLSHSLLKGPAGRDWDRTQQSRSAPLLPRPTPMHLRRLGHPLPDGVGGPGGDPSLLPTSSPRGGLYCQGRSWQVSGARRASPMLGPQLRSRCLPRPSRSWCGHPRTPGGPEEAQWAGPWGREGTVSEGGTALNPLVPTGLSF